MGLQRIHYAMFVCGALAAGLPHICDQFPPSAHPWIMGATSFFALLTAILGGLSGQIGGAPAPAPAPEKAKDAN